MKDGYFKKNPMVVVVLAVMLLVFSAVVYKAKTSRSVVSDNEISDPSEDVPVKSAEDKSLSDGAIDERSSNPAVGSSNYPLHTNISTTLFWAGEEAGEDNKNISNLPSAWDEEWVSHFGGVDRPQKRAGYMPSGFVPRENPFYFALPYNDFNENGDRKKEIYSLVPWASREKAKDDESILKNRWIKIIKGGKVAYAQWEDVGPFKEDDASYVFGTARPQSATNKNAGLDVSPAVHDFLNLTDVDTVDWQFVEADQVPDGPWRHISTTSQVYWK